MDQKSKEIVLGQNAGASSENWKRQRVRPPVEAEKPPYIKGTEVPNYYLVLTDDGENAEGNRRAIIAFRPLSMAVPPSTLEVDYLEEDTRIRIVPLEDFGSFEENFLKLVGFEKKDYGNGIHYSRVTKDPGHFLAQIMSVFSHLVELKSLV